MIPGTRALTSRWLPSTPLPASNVTAAVVWMLSGGVPASARASESAIEKHDECAAASSSSGFVVFATPTARASQFTSKVAMPDESSATLPDPSNSVPVQTVVASLVIAMDAPPQAGVPA